MRRQSIYVEGIGHASPIPNASRIGNLIASGLIRGPNPEDHQFSESLDEQCAHMFRNLQRTVEAGGGRLDDIIKVTIWVKTLARKPINDQWAIYFPDPDCRPARQVMEAPMEPGIFIQCDFLAVIN